MPNLRKQAHTLSNIVSAEWWSLINRNVKTKQTNKQTNKTSKTNIPTRTHLFRHRRGTRMGK